MSYAFASRVFFLGGCQILHRWLMIELSWGQAYDHVDWELIFYMIRKVAEESSSWCDGWWTLAPTFSHCSTSSGERGGQVDFLSHGSVVNTVWSSAQGIKYFSLLEICVMGGLLNIIGSWVVMGGSGLTHDPTRPDPLTNFLCFLV